MSTSLKRIPSLDGFRAIAITLVIFAHIAGSDGCPTWLHLPSLYGTLGVRIFFVISGFLITSLLLREKEKTGKIDLKNFYIRRAYRILPASYVFVLIVAIVGHRLMNWKSLVAAIVYLENYAPRNLVLGHLWSLSIEEQFYLLWPLVLLFFFRNRVPIAVAALLFGPLYRGFAYVTGNLNTLVWFPAVEDGLITGCLLALLGTKLDPIRIWVDRFIIPITLLTVALPSIRYPHGAQPLLYITLLHLGIALCLDHCIRHPYKLLNNAPIEWVGRLSYSLYLWQQPFLYLHDIHVWWTRVPLNVALAFGCAILSFYLVEKPFLALRDRRYAAKRRNMVEHSRA